MILNTHPHKNQFTIVTNLIYSVWYTVHKLYYVFITHLTLIFSINKYDPTYAVHFFKCKQFSREYLTNKN